MSELLLLNPAKRGSRRRKAASPAQKRARAAFAAAARARSKNPARRRTAKRAANPVAAVRRRVRRANPIARVTRHTRRRRHNPISMGGAKLSARSILDSFKNAAVGGAGALGMDILMGRINPMLPAALRTSTTGIGAGDAVKALLTVIAGKVLSKPTKGLSQKAAMGALTCQARDLMSTFLPASMTLGYYNPAATQRGNARVGPYPKSPVLNAYRRPGAPTPLLNGMGAYQPAGSGSPLLRRAGSGQRESVVR